MANNRKEKAEYRYLHNLSDEVPVSVQKKWSRKNFRKGHFRALRKAKRDKDIETLMRDE